MKQTRIDQISDNNGRLDTIIFHGGLKVLGAFANIIHATLVYTVSRSHYSARYTMKYSRVQSAPADYEDTSGMALNHCHSPACATQLL